MSQGRKRASTLSAGKSPSLDLEKFFDWVNHDSLMARVAAVRFTLLTLVSSVTE
jgi:hypothetical protein